MKFVFLEEIDSTNKYVKENLEELADKTVVYANSQTAGRGRMQRVWNPNSGDNIYASIVLKPSTDLKEIYSNLTQYLSLVLAETIEEYLNSEAIVYPKIKWPNDVRINVIEEKESKLENVYVYDEFGTGYRFDELH